MIIYYIMEDQKYTIFDFLREEQVSENVIKGIQEYRKMYPSSESDSKRMVAPRWMYYGTEIWEQAASILLCGCNLLLVGAKATGKNVLAENLALAFGRPYWNVSFHINMDASFMIGTDTFEDSRVVFRQGPVYKAASCGGFCILDEVNMARNEALAVLHSMLDYRRIMDIPGYDIIRVHEASRFIATMNYGYAGTRELNEALSSRFAVVRLPVISEMNLKKLLENEFPTLRVKALEQFAGLFNDLQAKSQNAEISGRAVDLRGLLDALTLMHRGLKPALALKTGITNKCFDEYEAALVNDVVAMRIPENLECSRIFSD
jgi:nitric oxide reductase NorQ protein